MGFVVLKRLLAAACLSLCFAVPSAHAANHGWYWGIEAGYDHPSDFTYEDTWVHATYTDPMNDSYAVLATLGGYLGPQLRVEAELGWRLDDFTYWRGDWSQFSLLGNVLYDMPMGSDLTASVGGGIGLDLIPTAGEAHFGFAYQLIAGLAWSLTPQTAITLEYRYMTASGPSLDTALSDYNDLKHQTLSLGLRFAL